MGFGDTRYVGFSKYGSFTVPSQLSDLRNMYPGIKEEHSTNGPEIIYVTIPGTNVRLSYADFEYLVDVDYGQGRLIEIRGPLGEIVEGIGTENLTLQEIASHLQSYGGAFDNMGQSYGGYNKKYGLCFVCINTNNYMGSIYFADGVRDYTYAEETRVLLFDGLDANYMVNANTWVTVLSNGMQ